MAARSNYLLSGLLFAVFSMLVPLAASFAHHSFAPYDIRNAIEIAGVAEEFSYRRPHARLHLVDDGGLTWDIEVPNRRWEQAGLATDAIVPGDQLVVRIFPARNGDPKAAMSGFTKDGTYYSVTEEVRQRSGNEAADAIERGESLEEVLERYPEPE